MISIPSHKRLITALMISPSILTTIFILVIPMTVIVAYSFLERGPYGGVIYHFSLESYKELFRPVYLPVFLNSLKMSGISTIITLLVAYPIAYYMAIRRPERAGILLALLIIPFWIDFMIRMSSWMVLLGRNGTINETLSWFGIISEPLRLIGTYPAIIVGMTYAFLPTAVLPIYAVLKGLDKRLLEAADDLGANPVKSFLRITLPLSLPGVLAAIFFVFVPAMGVYAIPVLLGGGKSIILGNLIVQLFLDFRNMPLGAALSVLLLVISLIVITLYMSTLRKIEESHQ